MDHGASDDDQPTRWRQSAMNVVVEAARSWVGTPYVHRASLKGVGADCLGLLRGIWRDVLACEPEAVPVYSADWIDPTGSETLWAACARHMRDKPVSEDMSGDILLFRMRDRSVAKHLGVQARTGPQGSFVHAYSGHGVVETSLSPAWQRRVVARFAFPLPNETDQTRGA